MIDVYDWYGSSRENSVNIVLTISNLLGILLDPVLSWTLLCLLIGNIGIRHVLKVFCAVPFRTFSTVHLCRAFGRFKVLTCQI